MTTIALPLARLDRALIALLLAAAAGCTSGGAADSPGGAVAADAAADVSADAYGGPCTLGDVTPGYHEYACDGLSYDVTIPPACATAGACGLIVDVHGFTEDGKIEDDNTNLRALGAQYGYVVVQPNAREAPPESSWVPADDPVVYSFLTVAVAALGVDARRVHMMGFSQGGEMTFRFLCSHADFFASVAPGAGYGCTFSAGDTPSREIPVFYMHGTLDALLPFQTIAIPQRDEVIAGWKMGTGTVIAQGTKYTRTRYTSPTGNTFEFLQHDYASSNAILGGHCYPGSTDPGNQPGQLFPFGCVPPDAFTWGIEAVKFFQAHEG